MPTLILALLLALLAGCAPTNIAEWQKAMAGDPASVCVNVVTIYGTAKLARSGCTACRVSCSQDGLTVTAPPPQ